MFNGIGLSIAGGALALQQSALTFWSALKSTLVASVGGVPTFGRTTTKTFVDFEGVVRTAGVNEAAFNGMRRVANLLLNSQDLTQSAWTKTSETVNGWVTDPNGGNNAQQVTISAQYGGAAQTLTVPSGCAVLYSAWMRSVSGNTSISLTQSSGTTTFQTQTITTTWTRYSYLFSPGSTSLQVQVQDRNATGQPTVIQIAFQQLENVTGQSVQTVGNYVSTGVLSSPWYGAGVDGVQYFNTTLAGAAVQDPNAYSGMPCGYLNEPAGTNLLLNSAAPVTQNITTTAQQYTVSFWGTGTCTLSGTATGTLTGTGAGVRTQLTVTATAGTLTLTFAGSNTNGQCEAGASASSYIPTTSAAVTRTADSDTYPVTVSNTVGTVAFTIAASGAAGGSTTPGVCVQGANSTNCIGVIASATLGTITLLTRSAGVAGSAPTLVASPVKGTQYKVAISWNAGRVAACVNGGTVTVLTGQTMPASLTTFATAIDYPWQGTVTNASTYSQAVPDATLQALTT